MEMGIENIDSFDNSINNEYLKINQKEEVCDILFNTAKSESALTRIPHAWVELERHIFPSALSKKDQGQEIRIEDEIVTGLGVFCACLVAVSDLADQTFMTRTTWTTSLTNDENASFSCSGIYLPNYSKDDDKKIIIIPEQEKEHKKQPDLEMIEEARTALSRGLKERIGSGDFLLDRSVTITNQHAKAADCDSVHELKTRILIDGIMRFAVEQLLKTAIMVTVLREGTQDLRTFSASTVIPTEKGCMSWTVSHSN